MGAFETSYASAEGRARIGFCDRYMFNRVMADEAICAAFLEAALGIEVEGIDYANAEQALEPDPDAHGIRMDVFARGRRAAYDVELQARPEPALERRFRYYQSCMDAALLPKGADYDLLPESYIVFLCAQDPFGRGLPSYTLRARCDEDPGIEAACGHLWVALNASAWRREPDGPLRQLLEYASTGEVGDDALVRRIDRAVAEANEDRKWVGKVWSVSTMEENDARRSRILQRQARAEGIAEGEAIGVAKGEGRFAALAGRLLSAGREEDLMRASAEPAYRERLFAELGI